jgi:hypothetical protein
MNAFITRDESVQRPIAFSSTSGVAMTLSISRRLICHDRDGDRRVFEASGA